MAKKAPKDDPYPFDRIFKTCFNEASLSIIQKITGNNFTELVSKPIEFSTVTQKLDFVYEGKKGKKPAILHLEVQTGRDTTMAERMYFYLGLMAMDKEYIKTKPSFKQIVLYLGNKNKVKSERDFGDFIYKYEVVYIKDINYEEFLQDPSSLVFAILGNYNGKDLEEIMQEILTTAVGFHKKGKDIRLKDFLKNLQKISKLRNLQAQITLKSDTFFKEKEMKTILDEIEEAAEKKGKLEGKLEDVRGMLLEGLEIDVVAKITRLSVKQIETVVQEMQAEKKKR